MNKQEQDRQDELVLLLNQGKFKEVVVDATIFTDEYKYNAIGWNVLALGYKGLGDIAKAQNMFEELLRNNPGHILFLSNLGNIYKEAGRIKDAISCYEKAINGDPNLINTVEALGIAYVDIGRNDEALNCFKKVLVLDSTRENSLYYLAMLYARDQSYEEALELLGKTTSKRGKIHELELIYRLGGKEVFREKYAKIQQDGILSPLAGCIGAHASVRYGLEDQNNFCSNPIAYVKRWHVTEADGLDDELVSEVIEYNNENSEDHMAQSLLVNGRQSAGNIFLLNREFVQVLKKIVTTYIEKYREEFKDSEQGFLRNWPNNANLFGWVVSIKTGGNLKPHIHKEGWLSGALYLNVPKTAGSNAGNIGFSLQGDNLPDDGKQFPSDRVVEIEKGDICMFPSSLFHYTIPFSSGQERVSFAFDLIPVQ